MLLEKILKNLTEEEREEALDVIKNGGHTYNEYGECCIDEHEDDDIDYSQYYAEEDLIRKNWHFDFK